ncbi:4'-phosphopantetheinyl transferase superfamily protein [Streptomyces tanashiensis]
MIPLVAPPPEAPPAGPLIPTSLPLLTTALPRLPGLRPVRPQLWLVATEAHQDTVTRYAPLVLDTTELVRAEEFRRPGDRATYLSRRQGLRRLLGAHLDVAPRTVSGPGHPAPAAASRTGAPYCPTGDCTSRSPTARD